MLPGLLVCRPAVRIVWWYHSLVNYRPTAAQFPPKRRRLHRNYIRVVYAGTIKWAIFCPVVYVSSPSSCVPLKFDLISVTTMSLCVDMLYFIQIGSPAAALWRLSIFKMAVVSRRRNTICRLSQMFLPLSSPRVTPPP